MCNLAMEAPANQESESIRNEKVKVLQSIPAIKPEDVVRGQFRGYLEEKGVAPNSQVETFAALKLAINSWRWSGVPFYIRAGKNLPITCTEILARLRCPPATNYNTDPGPQNYLRVRISPEMTIAMAVSGTNPDGSERRRAVEMIATRHARPEEIEAYERVLTDAMAGDPTLFARQDYVEEAWRIVDPILENLAPVSPYEPHTWGPSDQGIVPPGGWDDPQPEIPEVLHVVEA
jgi:glucose-6-phosphate 1-dehydrogenase